jgi:hypothetical protein
MRFKLGSLTPDLRKRIMGHRSALEQTSSAYPVRETHMVRTRWSHVWLALALLPLLTVGRLVAQTQPPPAPVGDPPKPAKGILGYKPLKVDPKDDELRKLQIARYNEAVGEVQGLLELVLRGAKTPDIFIDAAKHVAQSGLEVYDNPNDRIRLLTDYVELAKEVEKVFEAQHEAGRVSDSDVHMARYFRIDAEIQLLKSKRAAEKPKDK